MSRSRDTIQTPDNSPDKPGFVPHDPALYSPDTKVGGVESLDNVGQAAYAYYREHGFLVVEQALDASEITETLATIQRLTTEGWSNTEFEFGTENTPRKAVRKLAFFGEEARQCGLLVDHPGILAAARFLLGDREPLLFQTMMLLKPPFVGREKPWHQDHAYFDVKLRDRMIGIWIALDEATIDNGCMQFLDGGHKLGPIPHWQRRDWQICDTEIMGKKSVAVPLKPGGLVFFDSLIPHGTPSNHSPLSRRALQLHYAPSDNTAVPPEERMALFGTEGKDVTC